MTQFAKQGSCSCFPKKHFILKLYHLFHVTGIITVAALQTTTSSHFSGLSWHEQSCTLWLVFIPIVDIIFNFLEESCMDFPPHILICMAVKYVKYNRFSSACAFLPGPQPATQREPSILEVKRTFYIFLCPFLKGIIAPSRVGHPVRALPFRTGCGRGPSINEVRAPPLSLVQQLRGGSGDQSTRDRNNLSKPAKILNYFSLLIIAPHPFF